MHSRRLARLCALPLALLGAGLTAVAASAHAVDTIGPYTIAIGWAHEPTYVNEINAVQVIIKDASGTPVDGLPDGSLTVQVTQGSTASSPLKLVGTFDSDTGLGIHGDYEASIVPTSVGDYTFHLTGTINSTKVDKSYASGDKTFNTVHDATAVQFPQKVVSLPDLSTKVDRLSTRVDAATTAAQAGSSSASDASTAANRAMVVAIIGLVVSVLLGGANLALLLRRRTTA